MIGRPYQVDGVWRVIGDCAESGCSWRCKLDTDILLTAGNPDREAHALRAMTERVQAALDRHYRLAHE